MIKIGSLQASLLSGNRLKKSSTRMTITLPNFIFSYIKGFILDFVLVWGDKWLKVLNKLFVGKKISEPFIIRGWCRTRLLLRHSRIFLLVLSLRISGPSFSFIIRTSVMYSLNLCHHSEKLLHRSPVKHQKETPILWETSYSTLDFLSFVNR